MEENKNVIDETPVQAIGIVKEEEKPLILRMADERVNLRTSATLTKLLPALVNFHKNLDSIEKSSQNPFFKSTYADINNILEHIKPVLAENGLCLYQAIIDGGEDERTSNLSVKTILFHESGEFIETDSVPFPVDKKNIQSTMSSISYIRRYTINAICNLAFKGEDDDANSVQGTVPSQASGTQAGATAPPTPRRRR